MILASLNHREPQDRSPESNEGNGGVDLRELGLPIEDQTHNDDNREDKEACRVDVLE